MQSQFGQPRGHSVNSRAFSPASSAARLSRQDKVWLSTTSRHISRADPDAGMCRAPNELPASPSSGCAR
eukprot:10233535-Karenia_brevis.AAC.1